MGFQASTYYSICGNAFHALYLPFLLHTRKYSTKYGSTYQVAIRYVLVHLGHKCMDSYLV